MHEVGTILFLINHPERKELLPRIPVKFLTLVGPICLICGEVVYPLRSQLHP